MDIGGVRQAVYIWYSTAPVGSRGTPVCPSWHRIADEVESLARDRCRAAQVEPDSRECDLLIREAALLHRAAGMARANPHDGMMVHAACEGIVLHDDRLMLWGISEGAEARLRALAADPGVDPAAVDAAGLLAIIVGVPEAGVSALDPRAIA
jgi:hypothetical protein